MRRACLVHEQKCTLTGHSREVTSVAYSPDGIRIISGSADNTVKVWDAATGKEVSRRVLPSLYHLLLSALMLTCEVGPLAEVHADGALGICVVGGVLARRQAHRQRVFG